MVGQVTRGTTGTNRLRRVDRWIARHPALRRATDPLVADLGFGASAVTTLELAARLSRARDDVAVVGVEIDPDRVARARAQLADAPEQLRRRVDFVRGGFELPLPDGRRPVVIRAMNVLRQYDEAEVAPAWGRLAERLSPGGILVEGTCDELGRIASWVEVGPDAVPRSLTISLRLSGLETPAVAAERLPKALIHRNVPGERVHVLLAELDEEWRRSAVVAPFGAEHRWRTTLSAMRERGWPLLGRSRWRLGEVGVPWDAVAPR